METPFHIDRLLTEIVKHTKRLKSAPGRCKHKFQFFKSQSTGGGEGEVLTSIGIGNQSFARQLGCATANTFSLEHPRRENIGLWKFCAVLTKIASTNENKHQTRSLALFLLRLRMKLADPVETGNSRRLRSRSSETRFLFWFSFSLETRSVKTRAREARVN